MKSLKIALVLMFVFSVILSACGSLDKATPQSKALYFGDSVLVEYSQSGHTDDYVVFTFFQPGDYHVSFQLPPGESSDAKMPSDFDLKVVSPRPYLVHQYRLPGFLRITISQDGRSEYHDFE